MITSNTTFSDFLAHIQTLQDDPHEAMLFADTYMTIHAGAFPIIEGNRAHFLYKTPPNTLVGIHAEWNGWNALRSIMTPLGTGLCYYQHEFEGDARLDYLFALISPEQFTKVKASPLTLYDQSFHLLRDPLNAHHSASGFGLRSELAMPAYQRPQVTRTQAEIAHGTLHEGGIKSQILWRERHYAVYLPPDYDLHRAPYASAYFHDGRDYLSMGNAPTILDNLIHTGVIPPLVAIFIPPVQREHEYNCDDQFVQFFCDELVPEMQRLYHLDSAPSKHATIGASMGGLMSLYLGSQRSDVFGLIGAQSTATGTVYGSNKYDACKAYAVEPRLPLRLHLAIGSYESCFSTNFERVTNHGCTDLLTPVQTLCSVLHEYGYAYRYREDHQGHSWGFWRDSLQEVLTYLFSGTDA
jgi:enterochelin esterase family protein